MLSYEEAMSFTEQLLRLLGKNNKAEKKNKQKKKLHLVLDLDHTLVHTVSVSDLSLKEKHLMKEVDSRSDLWRFSEDHYNEYLIKLRPYVREFLKEANKIFSMSVYTMGSYGYAQAVVKIIDPTKVYFGDRVISREKSPGIKTPDLVAVDKRRVVILDDTRDVWPYDKRNLLQINKYVYFREGFVNLKSSYAEAKRDESRCHGSLANALKFLKKVDKRFRDIQDSRLLIRDPWRPC